MCRSQSQFAHKSQQKKTPSMAVCLEQDTWRASAKRQRWNTTVRLDRQYLGAQVSRAALPTQLRPEIWLLLTFNLQKKTSYLSQWARRMHITSPSLGATLPVAADPGGHGRAVRGSSGCRAAFFGHSLKVSNKNLIQQSSYWIVNPLSTRCVSW